MIASLVGLYSVPYFARLRPVVRETATIKVSVPCQLEFSPFLELTDIFLVVVTVFLVKPLTPEKISGMFIVSRPMKCEIKPQKITAKP